MQTRSKDTAQAPGQKYPQPHPPDEEITAATRASRLSTPKPPPPSHPRLPVHLPAPAARHHQLPGSRVKHTYSTA